MIRKYLISLSLTVVCVTPALAQTRTIADVARQERARRQEASHSATAVADQPRVLTGDLLADVLNICGVREQLRASLSGYEKQTREISMSDFPDRPTTPEYEKVFFEATTPDRVVPIVEQYIASHTNTETLTNLVNWCNSPLGRKVTTAEIQASGPDRAAKINQYRSVMKINPPSNRRLELLRSMQFDARTVEYSIKGITAFMKGIRSVAVVFANKLPPLPANYETQLQARLTPALTEAGMLSALYTYRSITDDELFAYSKFIKSTSFGAFNTAANEGMITAFEEVGKYVGKELTKLQ
jgi:hypothetical protein